MSTIKQRTQRQKIGDWYAVFKEIDTTVNDENLARMVSLTDVDPATAHPSQIMLGVEAAKIVYANRRAAALVAAMLSAGGFRPEDARAAAAGLEGDIEGDEENG